MDGSIPTYGSPVLSTAGNGSSDSRRLDETRQADGLPHCTSSIRSDSPRQTQYASGNIQLQAMGNQTGPINSQTDISGSELRGLFPQGHWTNNFNDGAPIGMNPVINNNITINPFDTEMSDGVNQSGSNSNGLTPASTNTYHSNPSSTYSPPYTEDDNSGTTRIQSNSKNAYSNYVMGDRTLFPDPNVLNNNSAKNSSNTNGMNGQEDPFRVPAEWNVNPGATPGFPAMTPDGSWDKLMQDGGWEKMMQDGTWNDQSQRTGLTPR